MKEHAYGHIGILYRIAFRNEDDLQKVFHPVISSHGIVYSLNLERIATSNHVILSCSTLNVHVKYEHDSQAYHEKESKVIDCLVNKLKFAYPSMPTGDYPCIYRLSL